MKRNQKQHLLALCEGAIMIALAIALDLLCKLIPFEFPNGGGISIAVLPLIYYTFRRGTVWGLGAGFVYSVVQIVTGWYPPPAGTWWAFVLCVLLDYFFAFTVTGCAALIAKPFGKKYRLLGYGVGAAAVCVLRFVFSFLSGVLLWGSSAPEGMNPWLYSLVYNGGYMLPNALLITVLLVCISLALDPTTLRPMKKRK